MICIKIECLVATSLKKRGLTVATSLSISLTDLEFTCEKKDFVGYILMAEHLNCALKKGLPRRSFAEVFER